MIIPEIILERTLKTIIAIINDDWKQRGVKKPESTILYDIFGLDDNGHELSYSNFNYLEQAKSILLKDNNYSRKLEVSFGYNQNRANMPTIHILLPNESTEDRSIGFDQDDDEEVGFDNDDEMEYKEVFHHPFSAVYNLMITSDNSNEVILMYNFFKYMLISMFEHIELLGLRKLKFGGQDLQLSNDLNMNPGVFHRNLMLSFTYDNKIKSVDTQTRIHKLIAKGSYMTDTAIING